MNIDLLNPFQYVSFDVFDTLVTRRYAKPVDLFADMEATLSADHPDLAGFAEARVSAELEARRRYRFQTEVTLEQIYRELARALHLPDHHLKVIQQRELHLEQSRIAVNANAKRLLDALRARGKTILFLSDTYLPHEFMLQVLTTHEVARPGDHVYISSHSGKMKATGALYAHVLAENSIDPKTMCHIGDNAQSDVALPRELGITPFHYTKVQANRYESVPEPDLRRSELAALAKLTRLSNSYPEGSHNGIIWDITADVSGPMIFAFVNWTIQQARTQGIRRLYFLSRDGQIMYQIAEQIVRAFYADQIEVRYLYVSRQSLLFPSTTALDAEACEWILAPTSLLTPRIILLRINFCPEETYHLLKRHDLHHMIDTHLDAKAMPRFRKLLHDLAPAILARAARYRADTLGYFQQEGLFQQERCAVVDIGWSGTLQRSISRLMAMRGDERPLMGFYFGLKNRKKYKQGDSLHAWFSDYTRPRELDRATYIVPMTELFTAADHGGVVRHQYSDGRFVPMLKQPVNVTGVEWGVRVQQEAMLEYTRTALGLGRDALEADRTAEIDYFEENFRHFLLSPTYEEAKVYGRYMDAEDQNESYHLPLARAYNCLEFIKLAVTRRGRHHNEWRQGSMRLTNCFLKHTLRPTA
jgi:predicted HAD superfamily hydrolase